MSRRLRHHQPSVVHHDLTVETGISIVTSRAATAMYLRDDRGELSASIEERLAQARAAAYAEGHRAGVAEASAAEERRHHSALEQLARRLVQVTTAASERTAEAVSEVLRDAVDLALEIATLVIGRELAHTPDATEQAIRRALSLAPEGTHFTISVAKGRRVDLEEFLALTRGAPITVREDAALGSADCIVEVGACRIENQIGPALDRVRGVLGELIVEGLEGRP